MRGTNLKYSTAPAAVMETPADLLVECVKSWNRGTDFDAIWRGVLSIHPLVDGAAIEVADAARTRLEVPLTTGQRLAFDEADGFRLLSRVALALRARADHSA